MKYGDLWIRGVWFAEKLNMDIPNSEIFSKDTGYSSHKKKLADEFIHTLISACFICLQPAIVATKILGDKFIHMLISACFICL